MENTLDIRLNKEALVVQANELIRAPKDDLTLLEAKLIYLTIAQICEGDSELYSYSCSIVDLANFLEISKDNIYRDINNLTDSILTKRIYILDKKKPKKRNGEPNYNKFQWVSNCRYIDGVITIRLNDELKPYLLGLYAFLTRYGYKCLFNLPTYNAMSLFNLLVSYESIVNPYDLRPQCYNRPFPHIERESNELIFSIPQLRRYFNCVDKYPNTNHFIQYVIDISVKCINKNSPTMKVSYRTAKEGRSIGYVLFKVNAWSDNDFLDYITKEK